MPATASFASRVIRSCAEHLIKKLVFDRYSWPITAVCCVFTDIRLQLSKIKLQSRFIAHQTFGDMYRRIAIQWEIGIPLNFMFRWSFCNTHSEVVRSRQSSNMIVLHEPKGETNMQFAIAYIQPMKLTCALHYNCRYECNAPRFKERAYDDYKMCSNRNGENLGYNMHAQFVLCISFLDHAIHQQQIQERGNVYRK